MKKILKKIFYPFVALTVGVMMAGSIANADAISDLLHPFQYQSGAPGGTGSKIGIVANIAASTGGDWTTILGAVIKFILAVTGGLAFISFTVAGVMMVTARGNEDQIKKGKEIMIWSIIGLAIIATSYAIVLGVSKLNFGTPPDSGTTPPQAAAPPTSP